MGGSFASSTQDYAKRPASDRPLLSQYLELPERQVHFILSNSATEYIKALYSSEASTTIQVQAGRAISSRAETRGKLTELLVVNYPMERVVQIEFSERQEEITA